MFLLCGVAQRVQSFGAEHTGRKLNAVAKYLAAYVTVMKKQNFRLFYVDAFAGSGASTPRSETQEVRGLSLFPAAAVVEGSPVRALMVDPPFDKYLFIEKGEENVRSLCELCANFPGRNIEIVRGCADDRLSEFCQEIASQRFHRAVLFLDPFGLSVQWETIERIAATRKVDLWYLVPVNAMSRQIKGDGSFLPGASKIDDLWGSDDWRTMVVRKVDTSDDLFGYADERVEKSARAEQFSEMFRRHLGELFAGRVSATYLPLGRGGRHEFSLMFACANPSPRASKAALRIADHILRTA